MSGDLRVNRRVVIPATELHLRFSTSGGPGGQHANKASTRVELTWNPATSEALGPRQRDRLLAVLRSRLDGSGNLRLSGDRYRSQLRNREDVRQRLARLVDQALTPPKARVATRPGAGAVERRIRQKKSRSEVKRLRGRPREDD